jgi:predicted RNase H-like nuclease (RuvC/YqgF family)
MAAELERDGSLIAELVSTSEQQQGRIRMLESELMQKESTISELAEAARDRLVLIDELTANNESAQAQLAPAAELQNRIVKLEQELVEKEATITELAAAAHDRLSVINQLEVTLAQLRRAP